MHEHRKLLSESRQTRRNCNQDVRTRSAPVGGANSEAKISAMDFVGVQGARSYCVCLSGSFESVRFAVSTRCAKATPRFCLRCRCLQMWWQSCQPARLYRFSACRGEHHCVGCVPGPATSSSRVLSVGKWSSCLPQNTLCVSSILLSQCCGLCRSFWRAGASSEELDSEAITKLYKVFSAGESSCWLETLCGSCSDSQRFLGRHVRIGTRAHRNYNVLEHGYLA